MLLWLFVFLTSPCHNRRDDVMNESERRFSEQLVNHLGFVDEGANETRGGRHEVLATLTWGQSDRGPARTKGAERRCAAGSGGGSGRTRGGSSGGSSRRSGSGSSGLRFQLARFGARVHPGDNFGHVDVGRIGCAFCQPLQQRICFLWLHACDDFRRVDIDAPSNGEFYRGLQAR
jgi:hypothetical protein